MSGLISFTTTRDLEAISQKLVAAVSTRSALIPKPVVEGTNSDGRNSMVSELVIITDIPLSNTDIINSEKVSPDEF